MLQIQFRSEYDEFSVITSNIANDVSNGISMNLSNFKHKINGIVLFMINWIKNERKSKYFVGNTILSSSENGLI